MTHSVIAANFSHEFDDVVVLLVVQRGRFARRPQGSQAVDARAICWFHQLPQLGSSISAVSLNGVISRPYEYPSK